MASMANTIPANPGQSPGSIRVRHPRSPAAAGREPLSARQRRLRIVWAGLHAVTEVVRRAISIVTLAVPVSYFLYALLATGIIRQDLVLGPLRTMLEAIVFPGKAIAARIFAVPMVFHGLDLVLVGWGLITLVLREVVLEPFRKAETWSADKLQMVVAGRRPAHRPRLRKLPRPCHS